MKLVTLRQFQNHSGISDRALVWLLSHNKLPCQVKEQNQLMVDIDAVEVRDLVHAIATQSEKIGHKRRNVIAERLANIVSKHLDGIIDEVLRVVKPS